MTTALQFSGGKDSLACLYLFREEWDSINVLWVNTGASYEETQRSMDKWRRVLPLFHEIRADQPADLRANGWPVDVLPVNQTAFAAQLMDVKGPVLQSYLSCCATNIWLPMQRAVEALGVTRLIRGTRRSDRRKSTLRNGDVIGRIEYVLPIEHWTDEGVFSYLKAMGADLPEAYTSKEATGRDCWDCTAYLDENSQRIKNLPGDRRDVVLSRLKDIQDVTRSHWHGGTVLSPSHESN